MFCVLSFVETNLNWTQFGFSIRNRWVFHGFVANCLWDFFFSYGEKRSIATLFKRVKNGKKEMNTAVDRMGLCWCAHNASYYINRWSRCFCCFSWGNQKNINMFTLSSLHVQTHWKLALCLFGSVGLSLAALQYKTKLSQLRAATNVTAHGWKPALVLASAKPKSCNNKNRHYLKSTGFIWFQLHTSNTGNVSKHRDLKKKFDQSTFIGKNDEEKIKTGLEKSVEIFYVTSALFLAKETKFHLLHVSCISSTSA